ncbi:MAG: ferric reductase-like transmembrane domain-containing protein [Propionibacteriaceae bacterium]|jgi:ferredoxin-NADP reductase|nr:ferric reductase-like transmembrane domain-containing protein [Propionibacteriaceae bacterium]
MVAKTRPRARPAAQSGLVAAGTTMVLATAVWWWVTTDAVTTFPQAVTEAGRLAGLTAGLAVVGLTVLAARIGPLDRAIGSESLYRWHAALGRYAVWAVVVHVVAITWGYVLTARQSVGTVVAAFFADLWWRWATVATFALIVVGAASLAAVRRRWPYEMWHALHLVTYAAILVGLVHQVTTGAQFVGHPVATALWVTVCALPVVVLLANRLVRPAVTNARHRFTVQAVIPETDGVSSVVIGGIDLARIPVRAGQYVRVHAAAPGLRFASNPYSLSACPQNGCWRITVAAVGEQSRRLLGLPPGTRLWLEGPLGGLILGPGERPVLLVAGGTGAAPVRALAEEALVRRNRVPVVVLYRVREPAQALYGGEWAELTAWSGGRLTVYLRPGPRTAPGNALTPDALTAVAPWIAAADVVACGAPDVIHAVAAGVGQTGAASLKVESFGW